MDRLTSMATYVRVVDCGSFAAAAQACGMSAQMVAKHVARLEDRLGARLLNRTTRRQSLTEVGRDYYERCRSVLAEMRWADALADDARAGPSGRLRVNAPVSWGGEALVPVVAGYLDRYPDVRVDLVLNDRTVDLIEDGFEVAFRIGPIVEGPWAAQPLAPFRQVVCAAPAYLDVHGAPETPDDLGRHRCLLYAPPGGPVLDRWSLEYEGRIVPVQVDGTLQANNARALLTAALAGFGIALIAEELARTHLASGALVRVLPHATVPTRPMHLLSIADRRRTTKVSSFIAQALSEFGASA